MVPLERNDHGITRFQAQEASVSSIFEDFGPLFRELRGRQWYLEAHAVALANSSQGAAQASAYATRQGARVVVPVVLGAPAASVDLLLRVPANRTPPTTGTDWLIKII